MPKRPSARGIQVIIAGAGGAAHLPGMLAAKTRLPVFGVPVQSKALNGMDSLLSIAQMPAGIPVGTLAIGRAGCGQCRPAGGGGAGPARSRAGHSTGRLSRPPDPDACWITRILASEPAAPTRIGHFGRWPAGAHAGARRRTAGRENPGGG